jgi:hypothetical protein
MSPLNLEKNSTLRVQCVSLGVTIQQVGAFTAETVKKLVAEKQKSHCKAILNGFLPVTVKGLNSYPLVLFKDRMVTNCLVFT